MGQYKQGHTLRLSPLQGIKPGGEELGRGSESISDLVLGAGSLRAPVVLRTPGNSAQGDPVEERGAPSFQNRSWATRRSFESYKRVNETGTNSHAGEGRAERVSDQRVTWGHGAHYSVYSHESEPERRRTGCLNWARPGL